MGEPQVGTETRKAFCAVNLTHTRTHTCAHTTQHWEKDTIIEKKNNVLREKTQS